MVDASSQHPFPGLRPFTRGDHPFFFGRERQVAELRRKLRQHRFIAVTGRSGDGKSSLVKAGLLPALSRESSAPEALTWQVLEMRPQGAPLRELARAIVRLKSAAAELHTDVTDAMQLARTRAALTRSSHGLVELLDEQACDESTRYLVVVDQFEELFRFAPGDEPQARAEAAAFVALLLRASRSSRAPVHVVLTMRSDFLGDCPRFRGLPEAINDSQFLVPRLSRDERRRVIEEPVRKAAAGIEPALVQRLLNDAGDEPDQLPVMQHALMRTWNHAQARWDAGAGHGSRLVTLADYAAVGTFSGALSTHADEVLDSLAVGADERICETIFKALVDVDSEGRAIRRTPPPSFDQLRALCGALADDLRTVIDAFRDPSCAFLTPPASAALHDDSLVDISHEALIRRWHRIAGGHGRDGWLREETEDGRRYQGLLEQAQQWADEQQPGDAVSRAAADGRDQASVLSPGRTQRVMQWWNPRRRGAVWAARYGGGFDTVEQFLAASARYRRRDRILRLGAGIAVLMVLGLGVTLLVQRLTLEEERELRAQVEQKGQELQQKSVELEAALASAREQLAKRLQAERAEKQAREQAARERSRVLAAVAEERVRQDDPITALKLVREMQADDAALPWVPEAAQVAYRALAIQSRFHPDADFFGADVPPSHLAAIDEAGGFVALAYREGGIGIWNGDGQRLGEFSDAQVGFITAMRFVHAPQQLKRAPGTLAAVSSDGAVMLLAPGEPPSRPGGARAAAPERPSVVRISDDGRAIFMAYRNGEQARVVDISTLEAMPLGAPQQPTELIPVDAAWSPDARDLLVVTHGLDLLTVAVGANVQQQAPEMTQGRTLFTPAPSGRRLPSAPSALRLSARGTRAAALGPDGLWIGGLNGALASSGNEGVYVDARFGDGDGGEWLLARQDSGDLEGFAVREGKGEVGLHRFGVLRKVALRDVRPIRGSRRVLGVDADSGALSLLSLQSSSTIAETPPTGRQAQARLWSEPAAHRLVTLAADRPSLYHMQPVLTETRLLYIGIDVDVIGEHALISLSDDGRLAFGAERVIVVGDLQTLLLSELPLLDAGDRVLALRAHARGVDRVTASKVWLKGVSIGDRRSAAANVAATFGVGGDVAVLNSDGALRVLDHNGGEMWKSRLPTDVSHLQLAVEGKEVLAYSPGDGTVLALPTIQTPREATRKAWQQLDPADGEQVLALHAKTRRVARVRATRGGERVVVTTAGVPDSALELAVPLNAGKVLRAAFSPNGVQILVVTAAGPIRLWDLEGGIADAPSGLFGTQSDAFVAATFAADGKQVAATTARGGARVWPVFENRKALVQQVQVLLEGLPLTDGERCAYGLLTEKECRGKQ